MFTNLKTGQVVSYQKRGCPVGITGKAVIVGNVAGLYYDAIDFYGDKIYIGMNSDAPVHSPKPLAGKVVCLIAENIQEFHDCNKR